MAIWQAGAEVLRRRSLAVTGDEIGSTELSELIDALRTGLELTPGVGLAAPQIGVARRLILVQDPAALQRHVPPERLAERERTPVEPYILINPEVEAIGSERRTFFEGCLSVDGYCALVERARTVRVRWQDPAGAAHEAVCQGWHARILQHEVDHLDGVLYVDRMLSRSFMTTDNYALWAQQPVDAFRRAFGLA